MRQPAESAPNIDGAAFPPLVKVIGGLILCGLLYWFVNVAGAGAFAGVSSTASLIFLATFAIVGYIYYWILVSRTFIEGNVIRQNWYVRKSVNISDITHIKFIVIPYLEWLIAPRLVVRVRSRGSYVFHAADSRLLAAFARISLGEQAP